MSRRFLLWLVFVVVASEDLSLCVSGFATRTPPHQHRVCVIGGTHGNEYTGVWCVEAMQLQREKLAKEYPALEIETILANPRAWQANKRFLDRDLNRCFAIEDLYANDKDNFDDGTVHEQDWELIRARELDQILGPKSAPEPAFDVAVDLHSTTSNMGTTLIFPQGDAYMAQAAAYIEAHMANEAATRILVEPLPPREQRPNVSSCAKHDFTIEVGPVPQGVLRHDVVQYTQQALQYFLEFLNQPARAQSVSSQAVVPCFHTAPADDPIMTLENGAMTGKIAWPCDAQNDNFPAYMVHQSVQDHDFQPLHRGDPLFVAMDDTVLPYNGSHGDTIYLIFVNEAGYYYASSGTGLGVAHKGWLDLSTGMVCDDKPTETTLTTPNGQGQVPGQSASPS